MRHRQTALHSPREQRAELAQQDYRSILVRQQFQVAGKTIRGSSDENGDLFSPVKPLKAEGSWRASHGPLNMVQPGPLLELL